MVKVSRKLAALLLACVLVAALPATVQGQSTTGSTTALHAAVTCAVTATSIVIAQTQRQGLILVNNSAVTIFVGSGKPNGLTTANGIPIPAGASMSFTQHRDALSCIVATGTADLRYLETDK